jgi:molybdenum cofactor guanylyltransferase
LEFIDSSAAILMGGASSRFGSDKSRCLFHTIPLYRLLHDRLSPHFSSVSCILRDENPLNDPDIKTHVDLIPDLGPLGGILTALHYSDTSFCFITAVDHPFLPPELPELLSLQLSTADIVVPLYAGKPQPLAAFYNRSCLPAIRAAIDRGERRVRSFWSEVKVATPDIEDLLPPDQVELAFINLNYTEDYIRAQSILRESDDIRGTGTHD